MADDDHQPEDRPALGAFRRGAWSEARRAEARQAARELPERLRREAELVEELSAGADESDPDAEAAFDALMQQRLQEHGEVETDLFRRWTMAELLDAPRAFKWRARGLMVHPTYGMLAGGEKTLKTYIAMVCWIGVASGVPIFGRFEVEEPAPVVCYVGEGGRVPWTNRIERVAVAMGVNLKDIPLFPSFDVAPVASTVFTETLQRDLSEVRPGLVGLDPFYAYHGTKANARNLYDEGSLLSGFSNPCVNAGACLQIVNHNNQTGEGGGLRRITMAGAAEWCDSWWLVSHREDPDVEEGHFRLLLEVGSRQWGGTNWELDFELGRFNVDKGEHDGDVSWEIRKTSGKRDVGPAIDERLLEVVAKQPFQLTREELAKTAGGRLESARKMIDDLVAEDVLSVTKVYRKRSDDRLMPVYAYGATSHATSRRTPDEEF